MEQDDLLIAKLQNAIPDDAQCVTLKIILPASYDLSLNDGEALMPIMNYLTETYDIICSTAGLHLNGKRKIPHIHISVIEKSGFTHSNYSKHRSDYFRRNGIDVGMFKITSKVQQIELDKPKYSSLSYPLKERRRLGKKYFYYAPNYEFMDKKLIDILEEIGSTIYETEIAVNERRDKFEERKRTALQEILDVSKSSNAKTFDELVWYLEKEYLRPLEFGTRPTSKNYKEYVIQAGYELGLVKSMFYLQ